METRLNLTRTLAFGHLQENSGTYTLNTGGDSGFTNRAGSMRLLTRIDNMYMLVRSSLHYGHA